MDGGDIKKIIVCSLALAVLGVGAGFGYKYRHEVKRFFTGESSSVKPGGNIKPDAPLTSTVKFDVDGKITEVSVVTGETIDISKAPKPTKEDYVFKGWFINAEEGYIDLSTYQITENVTFKAGFEKIKYIVTFVVDDERTNVEFEKGELIKFTTPTKEGYTFYRWVDRTIPIDLATYKVTENVTLTAEFLKNVLTVKFEVLGEIVDTQEVPRGECATIPDVSVEREGYIFKGWSVNIENYPVTRDITIVARYEGIDRTVRFIVDNEVMGEAITVKNGECLPSAPIPEKEGFKFIGWQYGEEIIENVPLYPITQNIDFIAVFEEKAEEVLLPYQFEGSKITKYTGTETDVAFPTSYSFGEKRELEYNGLKGAFGLSNFFERGREISFPVTIINSLGDTNTFNDRETLYNYLNTVQRDDKLSGLDFTVKTQGRPFIVGNDVTVTTIAGSVFMDNKAVERVTIPEGIITLEEAVFNYCENLREVNLSNTVINISPMLFSYCNGLKSIILPDSITYLSENMFMWCENLEEVNLSETLTRIDNTAFYGCTKLSSIILPASLRTVGEYAFSQCRGMREIVCYSSDISFNDFETLNEIEGMKIYLPDEYCETFVNANRGKLGTIEVLPLSSYNSTKENILPYLFSDNVLMGYKGSDRDITLPSSYTVGKNKETVTTVQSMTELLVLLQQQMTFPTTVVGKTAEISWNTYDEFLAFGTNSENEAIMEGLGYPATVTMLDRQYIKGEDINVTRIDGFFNLENNITEIIRVPAGIKTIGESAFLGYTNLRKFICYSTPTFENLNNCPEGSLIYLPDEDVENFKANNTIPDKIKVLPLSECENAVIYTLTFVVGDETYTSEVEHGESLSIPSNVKIPSGMIANYWKFENGSVMHVRHLSEKKVMSNMTLTARLEEITVTFTFKVDDGIYSWHTAEIKPSELFELGNVPVPEKEGYRFIGWRSRIYDGIKTTGLVGSSGNETFTAVFEKIEVEEKTVYPFEVVDGVLVRFNAEVESGTVIIPNTYSRGNKVLMKTKEFNNRDYALEIMSTTYADVQYPIKACFSATGKEYVLNSVRDIGDPNICGEGLDSEFSEVYFVYEAYEAIQGEDCQIMEIGNRIFDTYYSYGVQKLVIEEGITAIGGYAFSYSDLKEVVLPRSIERIDDHAFYGYEPGKLVINYAGTEEEWNAIIFGLNAIDENIQINFNYVG